MASYGAPQLDTLQSQGQMLPNQYAPQQNFAHGGNVQMGAPTPPGGWKPYDTQNALEGVGHLASGFANNSPYQPSLQAPPSVGGMLTADQMSGMNMSFDRYNKLREQGIAGKLMDGPSQVVAQMSQKMHLQQKGAEQSFIGATGQNKDKTVGGKQAAVAGITAGGRGTLKGQVGEQKRAQLDAQFATGAGGLGQVNKVLIADSDARYEQAVAEAQHLQQIENKHAAGGGGGMGLGAIGAMAGMAIGVILAPFTAGASLMLTAQIAAAGAASGAAIGGAAGAGAEMLSN